MTRGPVKLESRVLSSCKIVLSMDLSAIWGKLHRPIIARGEQIHVFIYENFFAKLLWLPKIYLLAQLRASSLRYFHSKNFSFDAGTLILTCPGHQGIWVTSICKHSWVWSHCSYSCILQNQPKQYFVKWRELSSISGSGTSSVLDYINSMLELVREL